MYQHSKTKKKKENWRDDYTQLMGIITGKPYQNSAEAFYPFPCITPEWVIAAFWLWCWSRRISIFTAVAGMSSRWVEPIWESYWLQVKAAPWQALEGFPDSPALPHSLVSRGLWIPPKQLENLKQLENCSHSHKVLVPLTPVRPKRWITLL